MKAMIFAAGLGIRLRPLTDNLPKALVPVAGKPLIDHIILKLKAAGIEGFVINVHHFASLIVSHLEENDNFGCRIDVSLEENAPLETGGGIKAAEKYLKDEEWFLVHNVDIISNLDIDWFCNLHKPDNALAILLVSRRESSRYLLFDGDMHLKGWMNTRTGEIKSPFPDFRADECVKMAFSGIHLVSNKVFALMKNEEDVFSIIDFYLKHATSHLIMGIECPELEILDVGKPETLAVAGQMLRKS